MTEWIKHDGKGMPVDGDTLVSVKLRSGLESNRRYKASWWSPIEDSHDHWKHIRHAGDIMSYRVHTPPFSKG